MVFEIKTETAEGVAQEEVILSRLDTEHGHPLSVKLITYPDGTMDLFRPTGTQFEEHIAEVRTLLQARGLVVGEIDVTLSSGAYLPVWKKTMDNPDALAPARENPLVLAMSPFLGHAALVDLVYSDKTIRLS